MQGGLKSFFLIFSDHSGLRSALAKKPALSIAQKGKTLLTFFFVLDTINGIKSNDGNKARKDASREPAGLRAGGSMRG